ncbi:hypothetical protein N7650_22465 [Pseudomonas sp. GD04058]|uniref:hypothetical protein n=1 Tax=Pseudomonas sp. GD04058 TaxID=2975429 RepID=UPI002449FCD7|nr:hypothetical protein [Pseudomonas sp. GD04058]MDG9885608.1 hypothetical protein [Pseudomonas sp. GD04058]
MHPLKKLAQDNLRRADPEVLIELALLLWYSEDPLPAVRDVLDGLDGIELRRAIYTLDRLRRFNVLTRQRYQELADLVRLPRWDPLKVVFVLSPPPPRGRSAEWPDFLAQGWGLGELERLKASCVLPYQTRHYAAERRKDQN